MTTLLTDAMPFKPILKESRERPNILLASGPIQRAGAKNENGRIYSRKLLDREVKKYIKEFVQNNNAFGELDHPDKAVVDLHNVSHVLKKIWWDGDTLMGTLEILPTPAGNIARAIMESGYTLGISSRGTGSVKNTTEGTLMVQDDFGLVCWDLVSNPSTYGAYVKPGTMNESKSQTQKSNKVDDLIREILCSSSCECNLDF